MGLLSNMKNDGKIRSAIVTIIVSIILLVGSALGWFDIEDEESVDNIVDNSNAIVEEVINIKDELKGIHHEQDQNQYPPPPYAPPYQQGPPPPWQQGNKDGQCEDDSCYGEQSDGINQHQGIGAGVRP